MATGIKDKVAIVGMGCSKFGERWNCGTEHLLAEAFQEALQDAGIDKKQIGAAWFGSALDRANVGNSAIPLTMALRLEGIPVTRVENMCATGTEALRGAVYAVAAGAVDIALAIGAEKLKDTGYGGLPVQTKGTLNDLVMPYSSAPAGFALLAAGYRTRYGVSREDLKRAIGRISWKSHQNGAKNPKAHIQKEVDLDTILNAPMIADPLGLFDCCGVSDGAACAIVTTPDIARGLGKKDLVTIKALQLSLSSGRDSGTAGWDGSYVRNTRIAAKKAYEEAGIGKPRKAAQHDGSSRLFLDHRTRHDGRSWRFRGRRCGEGCHGRVLRRRWWGSVSDRRRTEVLRSSDRRFRAAHGLRELSAAHGPCRSAPAEEPHIWVEP